MKIAIAGYGVEGKSSYEYFRRRFPDSEIQIVDEKITSDEAPSGATIVSGEGVFGMLHDFDLVVRTPGLSPKKIKTSGKIWSATNEFFEKCPAPIIGVTGSKGKGTVSGLVTSIFRAAGKKVHLVGNIGVPALDALDEILPDDVVVYELSSFQLWDLERSPHVATVLMIEPDHLDAHDDFDEYVIAKSQIAEHQAGSDFVIYHPENPYSAKIAKESSGKRLRYGVPGEGAYVDDGNFMWGKEIVCSVDALRLVGAHNVENALAAISVAKSYDLQLKNEEIEAGLAKFNGLAHRLRFVAENSGVKYYDDSIATTPGSAIAAINAFEQPKIIILGGRDKGGNYVELAQKIATSNIKAIILIGSNAEKMAAVLQEAEVVTEVRKLKKAPMTEVVRVASQIAEHGNVVVLSPAAASFGMFKNYADRGNQFIEAVESLD